MLVATQAEMDGWVRRNRAQIARALLEHRPGGSCFCLARAAATGDPAVCGSYKCAVWVRLEEQ